MFVVAVEVPVGKDDQRAFRLALEHFVDEMEAKGIEIPQGVEYLVNEQGVHLQEPRWDE